MAYERRIDRANPGCLLFLIDQSGSMAELVHGTATPKMTAVADQINNLLIEIILACSAGDEGIRHYFDLGLIGYSGEEARPALSGSLTGKELVSIIDLADNPITTTPNPVWVQPVAADRTPMWAAMNMAGRLMAEWANGHAHAFPPIVINISDGAATDREAPELTDLAGRLRSLKTLDGELLFFNVNISALPGSPILFPSNAAQLPPNDDYAAILFEMSSRLTPDQLEEAVRFGATEGARGFAFNSDITALRQFLRIGTMVRTVDDRTTL